MRRGKVLAAVALAVLCGCSIKRMAVNSIGASLAGGPSVYETDDDPQLVGEALPFSLKFLETLLAQSPDNRDLKLALCKGYTLYAYVYVAQAAEMSGDDNVARTQEAALRARKLFQRALGYGMAALDAGHPGFSARLTADPKGAAAEIVAPDLPWLYWSAAALGLAISSARGEAEMIARLPEVDAMLARCLALDEAWEAGTLHEFQLVLAASRPSLSAQDAAPMKAHFDRALALSGGKRASLFVAWAESVDIKNQNRAEFRDMLGKALAIDPDSAPNLKLANAVSQRRARWLLGREDQYFLDAGPSGGGTP